MNPFADVADQVQDSAIEGDSDRLGGNFIWDTDTYEVTIKNAYSGESSGGAKSVTFELEAADGRRIKFTEYVTSGKAKGQLSYYEKDGKKYYLPGFNKANAIFIFASKKGVFDKDQVWENKQVKMRENQQDVMKTVPVATALLGKKIIVGVMKIETNKTVGVDNGKGGKDYKRTEDLKFENEVQKIFYIDNKCSMAEMVAAKKAGTTPVAKFHDEWATKYRGTVHNDVKPAEIKATQGGAPAPTADGGAEMDSLFD